MKTFDLVFKVPGPCAYPTTFLQSLVRAGRAPGRGSGRGYSTPLPNLEASFTLLPVSLARNAPGFTRKACRTARVKYISNIIAKIHTKTGKFTDKCNFKNYV